MMRKLWTRLTNIGVEPDANTRVAKLVRISNQVFGLLTIASFFYIFIFYFAGFKREGLMVIGPLVGFSSGFIFNYYKKYTAAKVWFIAVFNLAVLTFSYIFGKKVGIQWVFFTCGCIPWVFFELKEWKYIVLSILFSMACYFTFHFTGPTRLDSISPSVDAFLHTCMITLVFVLNGLCLQFFADQNVKSERFLSDTYKQFFEDIPSPMWIFDEVTLQFLAVNDTAVQTYGYTREEFLHMKVPDIRPAGYKEEVLSILKRKADLPSYDAGYLLHQKKNGEIFYAHILSNRTQYNGKVARVALSINVNEKVTIERQNQELNKVLTLANEELVLSKHSLETQEEELRQINEELLQQAEELRASEEELKTQGDELKHINSELSDKSKNLEQALATLQIKSEELEAASRYKSEFLANMSHELRTPLNSILILANLLGDNKTQNLTAKQIEYAKIINKSGNDLLSLINDILDLSKIEAGKVELLPEPVRVAEIAEDLRQLFSVSASDRNIAFTVELAPGAPEWLVTDKLRLEQVVKNLLSNAMKFTPEKGFVKLLFAGDADRLMISVTDSGIGIPPEKQKLIFEAFQQADGSTSRRFGGTGLGLSISKELIRRLNGEITVASKVGVGSTFSISLPLRPASSALPPLHPSKTDAAHLYHEESVKLQTTIDDDKNALISGEQSLLIIDDDSVFASYVRDFAHTKGFKTIVAITGDEGIYNARKYKPAAIILDMGLPVIDGSNVLYMLKSDPELKHIPIHVVTALDAPTVPVDKIESFVRKPVETRTLEKTFSEIESYISEHYKNILILSPNVDWAAGMIELAAPKSSNMVFETAQLPAEAYNKLRSRNFECIVVDVGSDVETGTRTLREIKQLAAPGTYIITCMAGEVSSNDEKLISSLSGSMILQSSQARNRLVDEIELFLNKVRNPVKITVPDSVAEETNGLAGRTVLLADDDMRNVFAMTAILEEKGMHVIAAENGLEALELLQQNGDVDIILMDIMMPEMDGFEAMRRIRADASHAKTPILALTAKAMAGDREKSIEAGASDYITKPVDNSKLFSLMRIWLS